MGRWRLLGVFVVWFAARGQFATAQTSDQWVQEIQAPFYFAVSVADVDRSVEWYVTRLGLDVVDDTRAEDDRWRIVNLRSDEVFVEVIRDLRDQDVDRAMGIAKVGFQVSDVEAVADRIGADTGERPRVLDFARHGIRILQLRDPDGNIVQLSSTLR